MFTTPALSLDWIATSCFIYHASAVENVAQENEGALTTGEQLSGTWRLLWGTGGVCVYLIVLNCAVFKLGVSGFTFMSQACQCVGSPSRMLSSQPPLCFCQADAECKSKKQ